jgi:hypothetical protein
VYLGLGLLAFAWARETLSKTLLNRRLATTLGVYLALQLLLGVGGWLAGVTALQMHLVFLFAWGLTYALLAVWAQRWFGLPAAVSAASFLVACARPGLVLALMSLDNLVLTVVLLTVWYPREDVERIRERRRELQRRATRWFNQPP